MENPFQQSFELRWADLDPNFHVRHSVYYDWCATTRISLLMQMGMSPQLMMQQHFGPIIFREECEFKKELHFGDSIAVQLFLHKARRDYSRWTMVHHVIKNGDTLSAIVTVDGAFIDTGIRKLTAPPEMLKPAFDGFPRDANFAWQD
jgi:acyl-CoA thioester hydrolase